MTGENFFAVNGMTFSGKPQEEVKNAIFTATGLKPIVANSNLGTFFERKAKESTANPSVKAEMIKNEGYGMLYEYRIDGRHIDYYVCYNGRLISVSSIDARINALRAGEGKNIEDAFQLYFLKEALLKAGPTKQIN